MKFRVRSLMVVVAILGIALGLWRRHLYLRGIADSHEAHIFDTVGVMAYKVTHRNKFGDVVFDEPSMFSVLQNMGIEEANSLMEEYRHQTELNQTWHKAMRDKYMKASTRPWLPIFEPDGTEPPLPESPYPELRRNRMQQPK